MGLRGLSSLTDFFQGSDDMNKLSKGWTTWAGGLVTGLLIIYQHPDTVNTMIGAAVVLVQSFLTLQHDLAEKNIASPETPPIGPTNMPSVLDPLPRATGRAGGGVSATQ